ncbi:hypothetical protein [Mesorhizobium sp. B4-1-4]|uniref:hypothetical protein n=1 Tax=Mesorhizobium sp. B4-1-4 TaxID=2589888 RepID=UPI001128BCD3|nr:hypothetical protein [Mesorhizobium sp. B4-1-4]UCI30801.1 hypothetical protein FJW03_23885 [Mesorhizobium sp. B4-1-4]
MRTGICLPLLASMYLAFSPPSFGAEQIDAAKAAALAERVGVAGAKVWMDYKAISIPPSSLSPEERSAKIEAALQRYQDLRNGYAGVSAAAGGIKAGMAATIGGLLLYAGPQASVTVPLMLIGAASAISLDMTHRKVEAIGEERAKALLGSIKDDLVSESGASDFDALEGNPELLRSTLVKSDRFLRDIKERAAASGDPGLVDMAADVMARAAEGGNVAAVGAVGDLDKRFGGFVSEVKESNKRVDETLKRHDEALKEIGGNLANLSKDVTTVKEEVTKLGRNQDLIADFMFSSLPAEGKAAALRSGLMDSRIKCPTDAADCDPSAVKAAMVERFDAEARIKVQIAQAGDVLKGINDVQAITSNLGIDLGEDGNKALSIASGAVNAYIGFMSGDYLGSIAAVTGIFGKKPDPNAERFKVMMAYLKEQFGIINGKLDAILKNQQTILDAVVGVSKQIQTAYEQLDGRLDQMQVEQRRISDNVKALIWRDWSSCYATYSYAVAPNPLEKQPPFVNMSTLAFPSFDALRDVALAQSRNASDCIKVVRRAMATTTATRWFGNFLDADRSLDPSSLPDPNTLSDAIKAEANKWHDLLRLYRENIVDPASVIAFDFAGRHHLSDSTLLYLNASSLPDAKALGELQEAGWKVAFSCDSDDPGTRVIRGLVCMPGTNPDGVAHDLISTALNTDILLDIANWMTVVSQLSDIYDDNADRFAENIEAVAKIPGVSHGEEITRKLADMMTLAVAYHTRNHGGLTALAIAEDVREGRADNKHSRILANNPYLAENTANVLLHLIRGRWDFEADPSRPPFVDRYTQAYLYARGGAEDRFEPLYALFGRTYPFGLTAKGDVGLILSIDKQEIMIPLPAPTRLAEGTFVFPPRREVLLAWREKLIERYLDYQFGHDKELASIVLPQ